MRLRCAGFLSGAEFRIDEPLAPHTTFRVGGPADLFVRPTGDDALDKCLEVLRVARGEMVEVFVLGGGSNIVFSDKGVRGLVLDTTGCRRIQFIDNENFRGKAGLARAVDAVFPRDNELHMVVDCGAEVEEVVRGCTQRGLAGMEFLAGMPGTIGGAVWMNARCYGVSISDVLVSTTILDERLNFVCLPYCPEHFDYKRSPFQDRNVFIVSASFALRRGDIDKINEVAESHRADRKAKGHYRLPSGGSAFKNNYSWGKPTGQMLDELGLRGLRIGGAVLAPWHGNIIVNEGGATASDIRALVEELTRRVYSALGLVLEPEILFAGDWS